jgi:hypothetical protein
LNLVHRKCLKSHHCSLKRPVSIVVTIYQYRLVPLEPRRKELVAVGEGTAILRIGGEDVHEDVVVLLSVVSHQPHHLDLDEPALGAVRNHQVTSLSLYARVGKGVPQDYVQAHMWFSLAAAQGLADAAKNRDVVARRMTPIQIVVAQSLAREWLEKHQQ